jgi:hypothetical protein
LWPVHPDPAEHNRRSIYLQMKRSLTLPLLQIFDAPDSASSCARRERSTVAPQALAMMNSEFTTAQAARFAARVKQQAGEDAEAAVEAAWRIALSRAPSAAERKTAVAYLERNSMERLCLMAINESRRRFLQTAGMGFGGLAAALGAEPKTTHWPAKAKRIIHLFMQGGPSQVDTFDPKPLLNKLHGQHPPASFGNEDFQNGKFLDSVILGSQRAFQKHGQSGGSPFVLS